MINLIVISNYNIILIVAYKKLIKIKYGFIDLSHFLKSIISSNFDIKYDFFLLQSFCRYF